MSTHGAEAASGRVRNVAVDRERLRVLWGQTPAAVVASIVVGSGTTAVIVALTDDSRAMVWLGVLVAVTLIRLGLYWRLASVVGQSDAPHRQVAALGGLAWATAACWGMLTPLFLEPSQPLLFSIVVIAQFGIISGGLGSLGSSLPVYYGFALLIVSPMLIVQTRAGGVFGWSVTFMGTAYLIASLSFARIAYRTLVDAIVLRFANESLVARLVEEKDRAVVARRDAERATAARTRFLAAASHDLRQPLHAQAMFLEVLRAHSDEGTRALVERIMATSESLRELLDALLDVSKLDAGAIQVRRQEFSLQSVLDRIVADFEPECERKGLRIRAVPTRLWISSDLDLFTRILRNIVSNAVQYTERGGVLIGVRRAPCLRLTVFDSGRGIPETAADLIFEEFAQLDNPERDRSKGIGLGLAIVRRLANLLESEITLRSTEGSGSAFSISLDAVEPPASPMNAAAPRESRPPEFGGERILIIDDEATVRDAVIELLHVWGLQARPAGSIDEAVSVARAWNVDMIIADYRLRGTETGTDAVAQVRAAARFDVPAVLVTGETDPAKIAEARASGLPLLHKPLAPVALRAALDSALNPAQRPSNPGTSTS